MAVLSIESQYANTYLIVKLEENEIFDDFDYGMISNNNITGFLPILVTSVNGQQIIKYNITSKITLERFVKEEIRKDALVKILKNMQKCFQEMQDYMLNTENLLMDYQHIYVDANRNEIFFVCLPLKKEGEEKDVKEFLKNFLFHLKYPQGENTSYVFELMNYLNECKEFSLKEFGDILNHVSSSAGADPAPINVSGAGNAMYGGIPVQNGGNLAGNHGYAQGSAGINIPGQTPGGMNIPGQTPGGMNIPGQTPGGMNIPGQAPGGMNIPGQIPGGMNIPGAMLGTSEKKSLFAKKEKKEKKEKKSTLFGKGKKEVQSAAPGFRIPGMDNPITPQAPMTPPGVGGSGPIAASGAMNSGHLMPPGGMNSGALPPQMPGVAPIASGGNDKKQKKTLFSKKKNEETPTPELYADAYGVQGNMQQMNMQQQNIPQPMNQEPMKGFEVNSEGKLVVCDGRMGSVSQPYLVRMKTNEKIPLKDTGLKIGRSSKYADYCVPDNPHIGRSHAEIIKTEKGYMIIDNNSRNHTFVDGEQLEGNIPKALKHESRIMLSHEEFIFYLY